MQIIGQEVYLKLTKKNIDKVIAQFSYELIREPLLYFSEADLQQLLTEKLKELIPSLKRKYPTKVSKGKGSSSYYRSSLIHREYGAGSGGRFDVVILDKDDLAKVTDTNLTLNKKYLVPKYAFELGSEKSNNTGIHYQGDIKKLSRITKKNDNNIGYLIHIQKDATKAQTATASRSNTEQKLQRDVKSVFKQKLNNNNIKILALIIRTGRNQKKMTGKCEIYDGIDWKRININNKKTILSTIEKVLN